MEGASSSHTFLIIVVTEILIKLIFFFFFFVLDTRGAMNRFRSSSRIALMVYSPPILLLLLSLLFSLTVCLVNHSLSPSLHSSCEASSTARGGTVRVRL